MSRGVWADRLKLRPLRRDPESMSREALEDEVVLLREALGLNDDLQQLWRIREGLGLTGQMSRIVQALYRSGRLLTSEFLLEHIVDPGDRSDATKPSNLINVYVHRINSIQGRGFVTCTYGLGYALSGRGRDRIKELLDAS